MIANIVDHQNTCIFSQAWKTARQLELPPCWHQEWHEYISALSESHIRIKEGPDKLIWCYVENSFYSPKSGHVSLISHKKSDQITSWWKHIWKLLGPYNTSDYPITIVVIPLINIVVPLLPPYCYYCAP